MFWVPHPGEDIGLGVSVFSYRGKPTLGVIGDAARKGRAHRPRRLTPGVGPSDRNGPGLRPTGGAA